MRRTGGALRGPRNVALLTLGALAVHQTTYLLAADADLHTVSEHARHSYLAELAPAVAVAAIASIAISLLAAALRRWRPESTAGGCTTDRAGIYAVALLAVYLGQELGEALLAGGGHASVLEATLGGGAWLAVPLALAFGAIGATAAGLLDRAELRLAGVCRTATERAPRSTGSAVATARRPLASSPLAFGLSRRPPPLALTHP
jgi:hypothetical protein